MSALPSFERRFSAFAVLGLGGYRRHTRAERLLACGVSLRFGAGRGRLQVAACLAVVLGPSLRGQPRALARWQLLATPDRQTD